MCSGGHTEGVLWTTISDSESMLVMELVSSSGELDMTSESKSDRASTLCSPSSSRPPGPRSCGPAAALMTMGNTNALLRIV